MTGNTGQRLDWVLRDGAFVPFLALAAALTTKGEFSLVGTVRNVLLGALAVGIVLLMGRTLLRPLFQEIARSRLRELFTLAVLFVVLASAWVTASRYRAASGPCDGTVNAPR